MWQAEVKMVGEHPLLFTFISMFLCGALCCTENSKTAKLEFGVRAARPESLGLGCQVVKLHAVGSSCHGDSYCSGTLGSFDLHSWGSTWIIAQAKWSMKYGNLLHATELPVMSFCSPHDWGLMILGCLGSTPNRSLRTISPSRNLASTRPPSGRKHVHRLVFLRVWSCDAWEPYDPWTSHLVCV